MAFPSSTLLFGAGKMGGAMLEGWLAQGLPPASLTVIDPMPSDSIKALAAKHGFALNPTAPKGPFAVIVLAIKPQMLEAAAPALKGLYDGSSLLVSVLAGKTMADLAGRLPGLTAIVRAMPNLPASVGRGVTGAATNAAASKDQRQLADTLLKGIGRVEWVEGENMIDAVTAVSGSGPAYVFHLVECLTEAGIAEGLPRPVAERLARATIEGAGELLYRSDLSPETLRQNVTSPGGTTAAALTVLMADNGLKPLMVKAVAAARRRAEELSG
jgi:pyrroline-5-carboxylate reductase